MFMICLFIFLGALTLFLVYKFLLFNIIKTFIFLVFTKVLRRCSSTIELNYSTKNIYCEMISRT